jgi:hypothetical protein
VSDAQDAPRAGQQPVERTTAQEETGAPVTQAEVEPGRRPPGLPDDVDIVSEPDGAGTAGGSSGGSGGGSGMPGHPDAAR